MNGNAANRRRGLRCSSGRHFLDRIKQNVRSAANGSKSSSTAMGRHLFLIRLPIIFFRNGTGKKRNGNGLFSRRRRRVVDADQYDRRTSQSSEVSDDRKTVETTHLTGKWDAQSHTLEKETIRKLRREKRNERRCKPQCRRFLPPPLRRLK